MTKRPEIAIGTKPLDASQASQTDWSMILEAAHGEAEPARQAWETLSRRYWPAIYAYARRSGHDVHEAADLTQGFVCEVMLGRGMVEAADPTRGRFRTLLLTALKNYIAERHRYATRLKRSPGPDEKLLELDRDELRGMAIAAEATPEAAFAAQWSTALVTRVLDHVRDGCTEAGLGPHWTVFEARVVAPMLRGAEPTDYAVLVDRLNLKDSGQAANMMITVKRRFARALYEEVGQTVSEPGQIEEEIHELLRDLERA